MNRVVLCGRLVERPKLAYTPAGVAVACLQLQVPRAGPDGNPEVQTDEIDCVAFREVADNLALWGERGDLINLEGQLRRDTWRDASNRKLRGLRVYVDHAYFVDPLIREHRARVARALSSATDTPSSEPENPTDVCPEDAAPSGGAAVPPA